MDMRNIFKVLPLAAVLFLFAVSASAQCMVTDSLIKIYPYFEKDDAMIYSREHLTMKIVGNDTTITLHRKDDFELVCKKANDKKGYLLEETLLNVTNLSSEDVDGNKEMKQALNDALLQSTIGMKVRFSIDPYGRNLQVEEPDKVAAEIQQMVSDAWDSFVSKYPIMGTLLSKETMTGMYKNMLATPELVLNNFEEIVQLFNMHGNVYEYEVLQSAPMDSQEYIRPGIVRYIALDVPDEGQPKQNYDDYKFILEGESYQDAVTATLAKLSQTYGREIKRDQLEVLLGDKMPSGEIVVGEYMENEYFSDGWPKELYYRLSNTTDAETVVDIKYLVWEERHVKR